MWGCFLMSGVKILHFLKDWWKSISIHQNYTMALNIIQNAKEKKYNSPLQYNTEYYIMQYNATIVCHTIYIFLNALQSWDMKRCMTNLMKTNLHCYYAHNTNSCKYECVNGVVGKYLHSKESIHGNSIKIINENKGAKNLHLPFPSLTRPCKFFV